MHPRPFARMASLEVNKPIANASNTFPFFRCSQQPCVEDVGSCVCARYVACPARLYKSLNIHRVFFHLPLIAGKTEREDEAECWYGVGGRKEGPIDIWVWRGKEEGGGELVLGEEDWATAVSLSAKPRHHAVGSSQTQTPLAE